jgi:hypothetical protein
MTKKKLEKKLIVTTDFDGLNEADLAQSFTDKATAAQNNPTIAPGLIPTPPAVLTQIGARQSLILQRGLLQAAQKNNTEQIHHADETLKDIFTSKWAPIIQASIGSDVSKAKMLYFGIKGIDDGHAPISIETVATSHPNISRIDINIHLQHTLNILNSITGHAKLPDDAKQIDIFEQVGGTPPVDIKLMTYVGIAKRGKFINHFDATELGKTVYYMVVYIDKKTLEPLEQSPVFTAVIN